LETTRSGKTLALVIYYFKGLVGAVNTLKAACKQFGYCRTPNLASCHQMLM
jgi:hypothetical protein